MLGNSFVLLTGTTTVGNWVVSLWWGSQVLEPHSRRVDEGFSEARVLAEVSLLPDKVRVMSGRRPVAMATGNIDRYKIGQPQKQVLVVVTSGWSVMCFDSNLQKLWENNLQVRCFSCAVISLLHHVGFY